MHLPIGFVVLILCALSHVQCQFMSFLDDDAVNVRRSGSMVAIGKAVIQRLTQSAIKYTSHSTDTVTKYGKLGGWNAAKTDFRDVVKHADRGSVRQIADPSGRNVVEMRAKVGDRHIHLLREGYNGHPTMVVTDHLVHKSHVDEFIYMP